MMPANSCSSRTVERDMPSHRIERLSSSTQTGLATKLVLQRSRRLVKLVLQRSRRLVERIERLSSSTQTGLATKLLLQRSRRLVNGGGFRETVDAFCKMAAIATQGQLCDVPISKNSP